MLLCRADTVSATSTLSSVTLIGCAGISPYVYLLEQIRYLEVDLKPVALLERSIWQDVKAIAY